MPTLYDADGNAIEGALPPEEATELQEKMKEYEEKAKATEELEARLQEKEEELKKYSNKDYNFKKLREKSDSEIDEYKKKMSEKERLMLDEVMELRREREDEKGKRLEEAKEEVLRSLAGDDENLRKSILAAEKELTGAAVTQKELEDRYRKAFILARGVSPKADPIFSGYSSSYKEAGQASNYVDTPEGEANFKAWFPDIANKMGKK